MNENKYIGMDVHKASVSVGVLDGEGKLVLEATMKMESAALLEFFRGLSGSLQVTFEEGTQAQWLYELLAPRVSQVVVCDARQVPASKSKNKSDRIDARKLAEWLRLGILKPVYHGRTDLRTLQELARSYTRLTEDATRTMGRLKAIYRGRAMPCPGSRVYSPKFRASWLEQWREPGVRRRVERLYTELDLQLLLRQEARHDMLAASRQHPAHKLLRSIPQLGPVRTALLLALLQTPHRFRGKRPLWAYAGLGLVTRSSADYRLVNGQLERARRPALVLGLNVNHHRELPAVFKGAASGAMAPPGPWKDFYARRVAEGMRPPLALMTLARKIAAVTLTVGKKGEPFDVAHLKTQAAGASRCRALPIPGL